MSLESFKLDVPTVTQGELREYIFKISNAIKRAKQ